MTSISIAKARANLYKIVSDVNEYSEPIVASGVYYMEWKFNLWNEGCLTANSITITLNEEDIKKLREYLYNIINQ